MRKSGEFKLERKSYFGNIKAVMDSGYDTSLQQIGRAICSPFALISDLVIIPYRFIYNIMASREVKQSRTR